MTKTTHTAPDFVFETSWEVCNKVGGIYTVLSSKAKTMQEIYKGQVIFIGPDLWADQESPWFEEDPTLFSAWKKQATNKENLKIRIGHWLVPGKPVAILVDFQQYYAIKGKIYAEMWDKFGVDSLLAYGDYDEASMFAYSVGATIESFYNYEKLDKKNVVAHFNEWMLGIGALYVKEYLPKVATVFTTHATSIGRSIAGNNKPLYNYLPAYNGDQMAKELNMVAKHSIEKIAAQAVDCFTTVSHITAKECEYLLECKPEVTPNGFESDFVPKGAEYTQKRKAARKALINLAEKLTGTKLDTKALLVATSGRYEYRNKGIDVFVDSLNRLRHNEKLDRDVVAFIMVPAWIKEPRADLQERLKSKKTDPTPLHEPNITHWLHEMDSDPVLQQVKYLGLDNLETDKVKIIFVPSYLNGTDGILDMTYYDLLLGLDVTVFPSYYEPWGYTPLESIAFSVPTITTSLAGFGLWAKKAKIKGIEEGVEVITRDDENFIQVSEKISKTLYSLSTKDDKELQVLKKTALKKAELADWKHFFGYYEEAYSKAFDEAAIRLSAKKGKK